MNREEQQALLKKLNWKEGMKGSLLHPPQVFAGLLEDAGELPGDEREPLDFLLAFAQREEEVVRIMAEWKGKLGADPLIWFSYPKKSSPLYQKGNITRDQGWGALGEAGFEPVRQVALDEDWSALRFRKAGKIGKMTRNLEMALSEEGRARRGKA